VLLVGLCVIGFKVVGCDVGARVVGFNVGVGVVDLVV
jgi:hypothetical protein